MRKIMSTIHRLSPMVIAALFVGATVSNAAAQSATAGIVSPPCPSPDPAAEARLKPIDDLFMTPAASSDAFWAAFRQLRGHRARGGRGAIAPSRLPTGQPVSLQGGERDALARTAAARCVHGRLDYRQLGPRRSGAVRRRHRRSWHWRPDIAANAGAVPAGRRCAATARRTHHGWHERHRRDSVRRRSNFTEDDIWRRSTSPV